MSEESGKEIREWDRWFNKFVQPVFIPENRDRYYQKLKDIQAPFFPKHWIAEKFYETIKNDSRFDEELKLFFSFLYSCGFFMENVISFEEWLKTPNWWQPHLKESSKKTILNTLEEPNGLNTLKIELRWLPFINRPEGF